MALTIRLPEKASGYEQRQVRWCGELVFGNKRVSGVEKGSREAEKAVLFCYGNPGVGKTFLRYHKWPVLWKSLELH